MKILYAVQATGNGHISRAITLLPYLSKFGTVDVFLSGNNSNLSPNLPIKFRSRGISLFYNRTGGLDYLKIAKQRNPVSVWKEIKELPVEKYDLILNDFDMITSVACLLKKIPSIHFGHQASFQSNLVPRPKNKSWHGELLLKNYVKSTHDVGLHFKSYDKGIFGAIIKEEILRAEPKDQEYITVYLPSHNPERLYSIFSEIKKVNFEIFSRGFDRTKKIENITFQPIDNRNFTKSMVNCHGIICGAGFETPAEALHLGKKILAIPIKGQYEQACNAAALHKLGITCLDQIGPDSIQQIKKWIELDNQIRIDYSSSINKSLSFIFQKLVPQYQRKLFNSQFILEDNLEPILNNSTFA
jgi:uncharacterized protein (TIGR00661 family)